MVWILTKNLAKSRVNEKLAIPSVVSKKKEEGGGGVDSCFSTSLSIVELVSQCFDEKYFLGQMGLEIKILVQNSYYK